MRLQGHPARAISWRRSASVFLCVALQALALQLASGGKDALAVAGNDELEDNSVQALQGQTPPTKLIVAVAGDDEAEDEEAEGRTVRILKGQGQGNAAFKAKDGVSCPNGTVLSASGACVDGWKIDYCKWGGYQLFIKTSYNYYGHFRLVRLPMPGDAILPNPGEYAVNGECSFIVDSTCTVVRRFQPCQACCYSSPEKITVSQPCFRDVTKWCTYTYSQFTATCGTPPAGINTTTVCKVCDYRG